MAFSRSLDGPPISRAHPRPGASTATRTPTSRCATAGRRGHPHRALEERPEHSPGVHSDPDNQSGSAGSAPVAVAGIATDAGAGAAAPASVARPARRPATRTIAHPPPACGRRQVVGRLVDPDNLLRRVFRLERGRGSSPRRVAAGTGSVRDVNDAATRWTSLPQPSWSQYEWLARAAP